MRFQRLFWVVALAAACAFVAIFMRETSASPGVDRIAISNFQSSGLTNGVPPGWNLEHRHGNPDIRIEKVDTAGVRPSGRRGVSSRSEPVTSGYYLRMISDGQSSFGISRKMKIDPREYPYLTWKWAADRLPDGGDIRKRTKDDQAAQLYVIFTPTGFPHSLTAPLLGYIWDTECPKGVTGRNAHPLAGRVRYIVLRNKGDRAGQWQLEKRNIYEDYKKLFKDINGGDPPMVEGVTFFINAHNTKTQAESRFGDAYFTKD